MMLSPRRLAAGALGGLVATAPMTAAMELMFRRLPRDEQYPLPPRTISDELEREAGVASELDEQERLSVALVAHFAYGAAAGALYGLLAPRGIARSACGGVLYGLVVWTTSYLGVLPALGILRSATEQPRGRAALMIAAHVVWGGVTGIVAARRQERRKAMPGGSTGRLGEDGDTRAREQR